MESGVGDLRVGNRNVDGGNGLMRVQSMEGFGEELMETHSNGHAGGAGEWGAVG